MIRDVAGNNASRYREISAWPLGEVLLAFEKRARDRAEERHKFAILSWQIGGGKNPPKQPAILEEE